ncbi:hypothetical protein J6590_094374 [Homalodisca vitripennis]|nr:hypothetical protein J6590_094374 [Homalodisca vitripennis]
MSCGSESLMKKCNVTMPVQWVRRTGSARDKADNCGSAARDKADNYVSRIIPLRPNSVATTAKLRFDCSVQHTTFPSLMTFHSSSIVSKCRRVISRSADYDHNNHLHRYCLPKHAYMQLCPSVTLALFDQGVAPCQ